MAIWEFVRLAVPGQWKSVMLRSALRLPGAVAPLVFEGATDAPAFQTPVVQAPASQLRPGDVVIRDNLAPHHHASVKQVIEQAGAELVRLPPSSSDLTPIEERWSKATTSLRSAAARTTETLSDAMGAALRSVRPEDILEWFRSCGWCGGPGLKSPDPVHSIDRGVDSRCRLCATQE
jgi:hypothetical protein